MINCLTNKPLSDESGCTSSGELSSILLSDDQTSLLLSYISKYHTKIKIIRVVTKDKQPLIDVESSESSSLDVE